MRIIIAGAGRTGTQLARYLVQEKHEVSIIEPNEERARHASNRIDCLVLHDEGNSLSALEEAGIAKADALVCVTESDEMNMIICGLAASRYPGLRKIARVRNDDYIKINQYSGDPNVLGIDFFVHPDIEAARAVQRALSHGALGNILDFAGTSYELGSINVAEGSAFDGLQIKDYRSLVKEESLVTLIEKESAGECILPSGSAVLEKGDRIHILAGQAQIKNIFRFAGLEEKPLRNIGIAGGGRIGMLVTEGILQYPERAKIQKEKNRPGFLALFHSFIPKTGRRVVIIEQNYNVCKELAARFPEALVLNEDISDESFVAEEQLDDLDLIITTTANQELNMITAIYLKSRGVKRAIALVNSSGYETIARQLGVDVVISMQSVVVDSILSNLTGRRLREVHHIGDGTLEILETEIKDDCPAVNKNIAEFKLSKGGLIMLVNRGETSFIPQGDYFFTSGDKIIFMAKTESEAELENFFGRLK